MTDQPPDQASARKAAGPRPSPFRYVAPIVLGLVAGSAVYFGYKSWGRHAAEQQALAAAPGDPGMDKPAADECAVARAAASAVHAAGDDKRWETSAGVTTMSLGAHSRVINAADVAGFTDAEADNLRGKAAADWRWCGGMSAFVRGLGWSAMGTDNGVAELGLGRPGLDKAGDEARLYEDFAAPQGDTDVLLRARGPWLVTLHRGPNGAWRVTSTEALKRAFS